MSEKEFRPVPASEQLKILVIGSNGPALVNLRLPLIRQFVAGGHRVTAVVPLNDIDEAAQRKLRDTLGSLGVALVPADLQRTGLGPMGDLSYLLALRRIIVEQQPDRVFAYTVKPAIYAGLACRSLGYREFYPMLSGLGYAFTEGGGPRKQLVRLMVSQLLKASFAGAHTAIFQNPDDEELMRSEGILNPHTRSSVVSGSGVDRNHYPPDPIEEPPAEPTFLMVCRVLIDKGVREFAQAAAAVKARHPQARFELLGAMDTANPASPDADEISTWTAVNYLGPTDDVRPFLRNCDAFVLPSFYREGVPRSALEALSIGRAIVTTDHAGCRETVIEGVNGFKVPVKDANALAAAMERLLREPRLFVEMGRESLNLARTRFDVEIVNRDMLGIMNIPMAAPVENVH